MQLTAALAICFRAGIEGCRIVVVGSTQCCNHISSSCRHTRRHPTNPNRASRRTAPQQPVHASQARNPLHKSKLSGLLRKFTITNRTSPNRLVKSATMPSEVSDIKQFIEICRRKDAKCTFRNSDEGGMQEEEDMRRRCAGVMRAIGIGRLHMHLG